MYSRIQLAIFGHDRDVFQSDAFQLRPRILDPIRAAK